MSKNDAGEVEIESSSEGERVANPAPARRPVRGLPRVSSTDLEKRTSDDETPPPASLKRSLLEPPAARLGPVQSYTPLPDMGPLPTLEKRSSRYLVYFFFLVLLPSILAAVYYFKFASDQYVAEFRFAVTDNNQVSAQAAASSSAAALSSLLGGGGSSGPSPNYVVTDYLTSKQAVVDLQRLVDLRAAYGKDQIDWWQRLTPPDASTETLTEFWRSHVVTDYDPVTGLAFARVTAYSASDALRIAQAMVTLSENLVNDIAMRPQRDAVKFAENEVKRAEKLLADVEAKLLVFRTEQGVVNPTAGVVNTNVALAAQLRSSLLQLQSAMGSLQLQRLDSTSVLMQNYRAQIESTQAQLKQVEQEVSKDGAGARALADIQGQFETLTLDLLYAQQLVSTTRASLDQARANLAAQHLYLTPYVRPDLPDRSSIWWRVTSSLLVFGGLLAAWFVMLLFVRTVRDHSR